MGSSQSAQANKALYTYPEQINVKKTLAPLKYMENKAEKMLGSNADRVFRNFRREARGEFINNWYQIDENLLYKGEWKQGLPHGFGVIYANNERVLFFSCFQEGLMSSDAKIWYGQGLLDARFPQEKTYLYDGVQKRLIQWVSKELKGAKNVRSAVADSKPPVNIRNEKGLIKATSK